jgi:hypothetical protein
MCDECQGSRCGGKYASYFCGAVSCLQYYCETCWNLIHYGSNRARASHKPMAKLGEQGSKVRDNFALSLQCLCCRYWSTSVATAPLRRWVLLRCVRRVRTSRRTSSRSPASTTTRSSSRSPLLPCRRASSRVRGTVSSRLFTPCYSCFLSPARLFIRLPPRDCLYVFPSEILYVFPILFVAIVFTLLFCFLGPVNIVVVR